MHHTILEHPYLGERMEDGSRKEKGPVDRFDGKDMAGRRARGRRVT